MATLLTSVDSSSSLFARFRLMVFVVACMCLATVCMATDYFSVDVTSITLTCNQSVLSTTSHDAFIPITFTAVVNDGTDRQGDLVLMCYDVDTQTDTPIASFTTNATGNGSVSIFVSDLPGGAGYYSFYIIGVDEYLNEIIMVPQQYTALNAGNANANGTYTLAGEHNGKPYYYYTTGNSYLYFYPGSLVPPEWNSDWWIGIGGMVDGSWFPSYTICV